MLAEMEATVGRDASVERAAGTVPEGLRRRRVLVNAALELHGPLADVDRPAVRRRLEREHAALLARYGMDHLDISEVRSRTRPVTQAVGRSLYERGAAGVAFGSNLDDRPCYALFEGRAALRADAEARTLELTPDLAILTEVCAELGLLVT